MTASVRLLQNSRQLGMDFLGLAAFGDIQRHAHDAQLCPLWSPSGGDIPFAHDGLSILAAVLRNFPLDGSIAFLKAFITSFGAG